MEAKYKGNKRENINFERTTASFPTLHTSLAVKCNYCRYKSSVAEL